MAMTKEEALAALNTIGSSLVSKTSTIASQATQITSLTASNASLSTQVASVTAEFQDYASVVTNKINAITGSL